MQGGYHFHTIFKSIRGKVIFYRDYDRLLFLNILRRFTDKYNIKVLEFVLMDNHVHLLHTAVSIAQASSFAGELQQNFSFWYNRFHSSKDKLFVPAHIYYKRDETDILKCSFYILQNPMVACPAAYPHPMDYLWSSYHFHYNFMDKMPILVKQAKDVTRANMMFDIINNSRSRETNVCPALRSGFEWDKLRLDQFIDVTTVYVDCNYSRKEFKILAQKSIITAKEEYACEREARMKEYLRYNKIAISKLSELLEILLDGRKYEELDLDEKEFLISEIFSNSRATIMQVVMLLDEDRSFVSGIRRKNLGKSL